MYTNIIRFSSLISGLSVCARELCCYIRIELNKKDRSFYLNLFVRRFLNHSVRQ